MAKNLTATEVKLRLEESRKTSDEKLAQIFLRPLTNELFRRIRRSLLQSALEGTSQDRMFYCRDRAMTKYTTELMCFGSTAYNPEIVADRIIWWYKRLERIAQRNRSKPILGPLTKPAGEDLT